jgi:hypothetical protein
MSEQRAMTTAQALPDAGTSEQHTDWWGDPISEDRQATLDALAEQQRTWIKQLHVSSQAAGAGQVVRLRIDAGGDRLTGGGSGAASVPSVRPAVRSQCPLRSAPHPA